MPPVRGRESKLSKAPKPLRGKKIERHEALGGPSLVRLPLQMSQCIVAHNALFSDPTLAACRSAMFGAVLGDGLEVRRGKRAVTPGVGLRNAMREYWVPFAQRALDMILSTGIVVYGLAPHHTEPAVPYVPDIEYMRLYVCRSGGLKWFDAETVDVLGTGAETVASGLKIIHDFGFDPTITGRIASVITSLLPSLDFASSLHSLALEAERRATAPVVLTQMRNTLTRDIEGVTFDRYAEADMLMSRAEDRFDRDASAVEQLYRQHALYKELSYGTGSGGKKAVEPLQTFAIPSEQEVARGPDARARTDFVAIQNQVRSLACSALGLPVGLVFGTTHSQSATAENDMLRTRMEMTVGQWQSHLTRVLTIVYHAIYGAEDARAVVRANMPAAAEMSGGGLERLVQENEIEITFQSRVKAPDTKLHEFYLEGYIDYSTTATARLHLAGLPASALQTEDAARKQRERLRREASNVSESAESERPS